MWLFFMKIIIYIVLVTVIYNIYLIVFYYRIVKFAWKENGNIFPLLPLVGNSYVFLFTGYKVNLIATLIWAEKLAGLPINFWLGQEYHYVTNIAEETRIILNHPKCLDKAYIYKDLQYIFGNSLLLIPGEAWKPRRRYIRAAFKSNMIKSFLSVFYQQSCLLIGQIKTLTPQDDLFKFFNKYAFINFFLTSVGMSGDDVDPKIEEFGTYVDCMQDELVKLLANPIIPAIIWFKLLPAGQRTRNYTREMKRVMKHILLNIKKERSEMSKYIHDPTEIPLIDLLLDENYEKEGVFEEFTLFAGAATDTTGHTLAFCFTLLGMNPEIQILLYEEVMSVIGDHSIENMHLSKLHYTEAVILESLRILPSVPLIARKCKEDIDLGTKIVPKGANVVTSAYNLQRNPDYWPNPLKFDPTRFLPENMSKIVPGSYIPFSAGPRNCIGQGVAMAILKITVANVIKHYTITSCHKSVLEFQLESCISMKTFNKLDCTFNPRVNNGH